MTPKHYRPSAGGINLNDVRDVAIAQGDNSHARNVHHEFQPAGPVDLIAIERELELLRAQLAQLRLTGSDELVPGAVIKAEIEAEAIHEQMRQGDPDASVIAHHLGRLGIILAGVTAVAEGLSRLSQAARSLVGLG